MRFRAVWPVIVLVAALLTSCSSGAVVVPPASQSADASASALASAATPAPTAKSLADTVPDGTWNLTEKVTGVGGAAKSWWNPVPKKGKAETDSSPWVFSSTCTATRCSGTITRKSDVADKSPARQFTWDGKRLEITRSPQRGTEKCYSGNGSPNGHKWTWEQTWTYDINVETDADGRVVKLLSEARKTLRDTTKPGANCGARLKAAWQAIEATVTPV